MKILAIAGEINPARLGGAEGHFVEVSRRLISKGVQIETLKVDYPHIPNFSGLLYILFAVPVAVLRVIRNQPDLIWATLDFPQAQVGAILKFLTGIPLYITSQNPLLGEEELVGRGGKIVTKLVSLAFTQANVVAAVSHYSANIAKKFGAKKVVIIPNGVCLK